LDLVLQPLELPLKHPFTIARGSERVARTLVYRLRWNGIDALGESAPSLRYAESVQTIQAHFAQRPLAAASPYPIDAILDARPPAARCGLDLALHDAIGKDVDRPLWQLLGLDPARTPITSFTIGIAPIDRMVEWIREIGPHPVVKVKLGAGAEVETLEAIRSVYRGTIRIDANEGWTPEQAVRLLRELERFEVELCEQPIPAGEPAKLRYVRERTRIPIVADEDAREARDLPALIGCVDGVNVKLVKCGGIRGALAMIHTARALGMRVMLGCMVESAICTTAAAQLSPLADWADLDGPHLTASDPFAGLAYECGRIVLPTRPGLGVRERGAAEVAAR
jgi:L-alanine-DL-glutamate epimerase-like enolase superfamily enzyme